MPTAIDYRHALSPRAQRPYDAVQDGNPDAIAGFAEHLVEEGLLGAGAGEMTLDLSVAQMVERYIQSRAGIAELKAWAMAVADESAAGLAA